jgi:uncharacterized membrane protein YagU involved in acid resistance
MTRGGIAGALATVPMTALMEAGYRLLPGAQRYPLPPRQITEQVARIAEVGMPAEEPRRVLVTLLAHFGYGAASGAMYGATSVGSIGSGARRGILFGILVWTVSYLGFLPALGLLSPATRHPWRRNVLMIAAHVVWGAGTGMLTAALRRPQETARGMSATAAFRSA